MDDYEDEQERKERRRELEAQQESHVVRWIGFIIVMGTVVGFMSKDTAIAGAVAAGGLVMAAITFPRGEP